MQKIKTIIVVLIVAGLAYMAYHLSQTDDNNTKLATEALSDFAVEDTASIDKLVLTDTEGSPGVRLVRNGDQWTSKSGECIQQHLVQTILKTIKRVKVKSPVGSNTMETVNKSLTAHHKKVEIFQNGELTKVWYVGNPTPDHYGTYMLLKDPEKGKSPEPFIMYLPGMHGSLKSRFITNPKEFECTEIFNYNVLDIESVHVQQPDSTQHNFKIVSNGKNDFSLLSNGENVGAFDTAIVRNYLLHYKKIHFERHNYEYSKHEIDSLRNETPYFIIEVKAKKAEDKKINIYKRKYHYEKYGIDGSLLKWDQDRCWVFLPDGHLVVGQYYTFDRLLRPLGYFRPEEISSD